MNHTIIYVLMFLLISLQGLAYEASIEDVKINVSVSGNTITLRSPGGGVYVFNGNINDSYIWSLPDFRWNLSNQDYDNLTGFNKCPDLRIEADAFKCAPGFNYTINVPPAAVEVKINASTFDNEDREDLAVLKEQVEGIQSSVNGLVNPEKEDSPFTKEYYDMPLWFILGVLVILALVVGFYKNKFASKLFVEKEASFKIPLTTEKPIEKVYKQNQTPLSEIDVYKPRKTSLQENHDAVKFTVAGNGFEKMSYHDKIEHDVALALKDDLDEKARLEDEKKVLQEELNKASKPREEPQDIKEIKQEINALRSALSQVKG